MGSWLTSNRPPGTRLSTMPAVDPAGFLGVPAELIDAQAPFALACAIGLPVSLEIIRAASGVRRTISSAMAWIASARAKAGVARHV